MKNMASAVLFTALLVAGIAAHPGTAHAFTASSLSADVIWSLYLDGAAAPLLSATVSSGGEFVIDADGMNASGSPELLAALDGVRFTLQGTSTGDAFEVRLILHAHGDAFDSFRGTACSFNMSAETYVDGHKTDTSTATITMTIPTGAGLDYLLELGGTNRTDLAFVADNGGLEPDRLETSIMTQTVSVSFSPSTTLIGGSGVDLGIPASVEYSTWYRVKKLFE